MRIYNTLTRKVDELRPLVPGRVGMYVCGPTTQSEPHLGHARQAVVFDVLYRFLSAEGYDVVHVANVTDVEDKIIARAAEEGQDPLTLSRHYAGVFFEAYDRLAVLPPTHRPFATEHIGDMIEQIETLLRNGHAYETPSGVYFAVDAFPGYGKLSRRRLEDLRAGARVEPGEDKRNPLDFALWKAAKPGEPSWPAPFGAGRPGWHIECSAMATRYLGRTFDIHGGGADLVFPHHENEIAQAEAANGVPFAIYWVHNGFVTLHGEKMSKSTKNYISLPAALEKVPGAALRLWFLHSHYRSQIDFSESAIEDARGAYDRIEAVFRRAARAGQEPAAGDVDDAMFAPFRDALADDLDTPAAVAQLFTLVRRANRLLDDVGDVRVVLGAVAAMLDVLGIARGERLGVDVDLTALAARYLDGADGTVDELVDALLEQRRSARAAKDFATADAIRTGLVDAGVVLADSADGTRWHLA